MSTRRRRLLVLTSTFPRWSGDTTPRFVADLCAGLARRMDVTVLAPASQGAPSVERIDGYTVHRFRYGWPAGTQRLADGAILPNLRRNPLLLAQVMPFVLAQLWAAVRLMRRERFDAVHAHWAVPQGAVAAILKRLFSVPVLTTTHGGDIYGLNSRGARSLKRWALRSSDRVTAVSGHLERELVAMGLDRERLRVLPMGVDASRFTPGHASPSLRVRLDGAPLVLFVGRLVEKKGARFAIEAMPAILSAFPGARLVVVGDGPERESLEALASALGVDGRVSFVGAIANERLPEYFASADLFLGPSVVEKNGDTEAFGVVFAEAMASGCPVVATDVGGIADVSADGDHAVLVPERDSAALAAAAIDLLRDDERRHRMRAQALASMRARFDHRVIHGAYADLVEEIAA